MNFNPRTHRAHTYFLEGAGGQRRGPFVEPVHVSRHCQNCAHYGPHDAEWIEESARNLATSPKCLNECSAADDELLQNNFCSDHQSRAEADNFVHRAHRPIFTLVSVSERRSATA